MSLRPGMHVEVGFGDTKITMKVAAINFDGKLILHPLLLKETSGDMMVRLQSTIPVTESDTTPQ